MRALCACLLLLLLGQQQLLYAHEDGLHEERKVYFSDSSFSPVGSEGSQQQQQVLQEWTAGNDQSQMESSTSNRIDAHVRKLRAPKTPLPSGATNNPANEPLPPPSLPAPTAPPPDPPSPVSPPSPPPEPPSPLSPPLPPPEPPSPPSPPPPSPPAPESPPPSPPSPPSPYPPPPSYPSPPAPYPPPPSPPSSPPPSPTPPLPPPTAANAASILRQLLDELEGGDGVLEASWRGDDPCGDAWEGVTCEMGRYRQQVVGLDFSYRGFRGPLPETLALIWLLKSVSFLGNEMEGPLLPSYSNLENLKVLDLGLNSLSGAVPASWAEGMASLQWLALDSNPSLCGSLPSTWTSGPAAISILTFNTALGTRCSSLGASSHSSLKPVTTDIVAVMSATFVWPGGDLTDLKVNGGLAEQEFRQRFRRGLAASAGVSLRHVAILGISQGSIIVDTQVAFPGFTAKALDDFVHHVRLDTSNVSHLFASEAALIQQYATPFITSINVEFRDKSSLAAASLLCSPRPIAAVYAPARARLLPSPSPDYVYQGFAMVLAFDEPFDLVNDCTDARYSCLLALGVGGQVQSGSAQQLDAEGKLFQVKIDVSREGSLDLVLKGDPCNPATQPHFFSVNADWEKPEAKLWVTYEKPRLTNSTFQVDAYFSEPILPLDLSSLSVSNADVQTMERVDSQHTRFVLEGDVGSKASVMLLGCSDYAGNRGATSNTVAVETPAKGLKVAALAVNWASVAAIASSGMLCAATAVKLSPTWSGPACVTGVLRSFGHLQILSFTRHMAANMPPSYTTTASAAGWSRLAWVPNPGTRYASSFSNAAAVIAARNEASPPASLGDSSTLDKALLAITAPGAPFLVSAHSDSLDSSQLSNLVDVGPALYNGVSARAPEFTAEMVEEAWSDLISSAILTAFVIFLTLVVHLGIHRSHHVRLRMDGHQVYTSFPKLLIIGLAAVSPSLSHSCVRVFSLENYFVTASQLGPALGALLPILFLVAAVLVYLVLQSALGCAFEGREGQGAGHDTADLDSLMPPASLSADTDKEWGTIARLAAGGRRDGKVGGAGGKKVHPEAEGTLPPLSEEGVGDTGYYASLWEEENSVSMPDDQHLSDYQRDSPVTALSSPARFPREMQQQWTQRGFDPTTPPPFQRHLMHPALNTNSGYMPQQQQAPWQGQQPTQFIPQSMQQQQPQAVMQPQQYQPQQQQQMLMPPGYVSPGMTQIPQQQQQPFYMPQPPPAPYPPPSAPPVLFLPQEEERTSNSSKDSSQCTMDNAVNAHSTPVQRLNSSSSSKKRRHSMRAVRVAGRPSRQRPRLASTPSSLKWKGSRAAHQQDLGDAVSAGAPTAIIIPDASSASDDGVWCSSNSSSQLSPIQIQAGQHTSLSHRRGNSLPSLALPASALLTPQSPAQHTTSQPQHSLPAPASAALLLSPSYGPGPVAEAREDETLGDGAGLKDLGKRRRRRRHRKEREAQDSPEQGKTQPKMRQSKVREAKVAPLPKVNAWMPEPDEELLMQWGAIPYDPSKGPTAGEALIARAAAAAEDAEKERAKKKRASRAIEPASWKDVLVPSNKRLWWLAHGWLVDDCLGTLRPGTPTSELPPDPPSWLRSWLCLLAHVLFLGHVIALGAVLGAWSAESSSTTQMAVAIAIKGAFIQYTVALRPYASGITLLLEIILSCVELVLLVFSLVNQMQLEAPSDPPFVALVLCFVGVGLVILIEVWRTITIAVALSRRPILDPSQDAETVTQSGTVYSSRGSDGYE